MFKNEEEFENLIKRLDFDDTPAASHRENLRAKMLSVFAAARQKEIRTLRINPWEMAKYLIPKIAAAIIIICAFCAKFWLIDWIAW